MTACLRCDNCSKAVAEHEEDLRQWWRLTRHGVEWAEEPIVPKPSSPVVALQSVYLESGSVIDLDSEEEGEAVDADEFMEFIGDDEPSIAVLHFCSSACLSSWASQASALED